MGDECCAHLTVQWRTENNPDGSTSGWWSCSTSDCNAKFTPMVLAEKAQSEGRRAGLEEAVEIVKHQPHHEADGLAHFRRVCSAALFVAKKPKP